VLPLGSDATLPGGTSVVKCPLAGGAALDVVVDELEVGDAGADELGVGDAVVDELEEDGAGAGELKVDGAGAGVEVVVLAALLDVDVVGVVSASP
jgi:hypothetical protein